MGKYTKYVVVALIGVFLAALGGDIFKAIHDALVQTGLCAAGDSICRIKYDVYIVISILILVIIFWGIPELKKITVVQTKEFLFKRRKVANLKFFIEYHPDETKYLLKITNCERFLNTKDVEVILKEIKIAPTKFLKDYTGIAQEVFLLRTFFEWEKNDPKKLGVVKIPKGESNSVYLIKTNKEEDNIYIHTLGKDDSLRSLPIGGYTFILSVCCKMLNWDTVYRLLIEIENNGKGQIIIKEPSVSRLF